MLTDKRIIVETDFITFNKKVLPYSQLIDVDMTRSPLRSMLGWSGVIMQQGGFGTVSQTGLVSRRSSNMTLIDEITAEEAEKVINVVSEKMPER